MVWKGLCWRENFRGIRQQAAIEIGGYRSRGAGEGCAVERAFGGIQQQEAIEVRGYRSRGLGRAVLEREREREREREIFRDTAAGGYRRKRL